LMMSLWDALRMNMMISYQELVRTFPKEITPSLAIKLIEFSISLVPFYNSPHSCLLFFYT
ncbi:hypothetical protein, partial [Klebsiella pneumoniae]|uniref:hypothetical protein n=1 Tax=Klebsiella pneumoniae TaxID=573 RepID=UPI0034640BEC